jgi:hypothetical protein
LSSLFNSEKSSSQENLGDDAAGTLDDVAGVDANHFDWLVDWSGGVVKEFLKSLKLLKD